MDENNSNDLNSQSDRRSSSPAKNDRVDRPSYKKDRPSPYPRNGPKSLGPRPSHNTRSPPYNRVFVQNIPYEEKWQGLKDLFRTKVGEVTYVELFTDDSGKSRGYGIVEFKTKELCEEAVEKMNRYEINSRKILVKLDYDGEQCRKALMRDGHPAAMALGGGPMHGMPPPMPGPMGPIHPMPPPIGLGMGPVGLGIPPQGPLPSMMGRDLSMKGRPIGDTVFVANLDYKVNYSKLKEVFQLAGRVVKVDLMLDRDNKSRGMATVTYEDPMDAAQAISMLNNQKLYDRTMIVKMDKDNSREPRSGGDLPSGLAGIGPALNTRNRENLSHLSSAGGGYGDAGNGMMGGHLGSSADPLSALSGLAAIQDLKGGGASQAKLAAGLAALGRLSETLQQSSSGLDLGSLGALGGLGDLGRLGLAGGARSDNLDQRILDEKIRLLTAGSGRSSGFSDRERIERDIERVDSRIRDIDRSLERGRGMEKALPPMPPPMNSANRVSGTTVFVRNLAYSVTWQMLRDKFARCGRVLFADIKNDDGKSRGYGNVRFETPEQAESAVRHLDGIEMDGRKIIVHLDQKK